MDTPATNLQPHENSFAFAELAKCNEMATWIISRNYIFVKLDLRGGGGGGMRLNIKLWRPLSIDYDMDE